MRCSTTPVQQPKTTEKILNMERILCTADDSDMNDHYARWRICDGRYEVEDRGDAIAEISAASEDALTRKIVGYVHADVGPEYDEAGHIQSTVSAFPGTMSIDGSDLPKRPVPVASVAELERFLYRHDWIAALWKSVDRSPATASH